eukprot:Rhum_TRINITY_DN14607_c3_g2::Rhum_TRINITY_DN14607_c3_g2_i1::g.103555::m.103555
MQGVHDLHRSCLQDSHTVAELSYTPSSHNVQETTPSLTTVRSAIALRSAAKASDGTPTSQPTSEGRGTRRASHCLHCSSYSTTTRCAATSSSTPQVARMLSTSARTPAILRASFVCSAATLSCHDTAAASSSARSTRILSANCFSTSSNARLAAPTLPSRCTASCSVVSCARRPLPRSISASSCPACSCRSCCRALHTSDTADVLCSLCAPCEKHVSHTGTRHASHQRSSGSFVCVAQCFVVHFPLLFHDIKAAMNELCAAKNGFSSGEHSSQRLPASFPHAELGHRGRSIPNGVLPMKYRYCS